MPSPWPPFFLSSLSQAEPELVPPKVSVPELKQGCASWQSPEKICFQYWEGGVSVDMFFPSGPQQHSSKQKSLTFKFCDTYCMCQPTPLGRLNLPRSIINTILKGKALAVDLTQCRALNLATPGTWVPSPVLQNDQKVKLWNQLTLNPTSLVLGLPKL